MCCGRVNQRVARVGLGISWKLDQDMLTHDEKWSDNMGKQAGKGDHFVIGHVGPDRKSGTHAFAPGVHKIRPVQGAFELPASRSHNSHQVHPSLNKSVHHPARHTTTYFHMAASAYVARKARQLRCGIRGRQATRKPPWTRHVITLG